VRGWRGRAAYGVNFHPSPLPMGRGPYPLFKAISDAEAEWGVTAHVLAEEGFDTGDILAQERFPLSPLETHETLLAKCQMAARRLSAGPIARTLPALWKAATPQGAGSYWPRVTDADRTLDFRSEVEAILRRVRAFGTIETLARVGETRVFVAQAEGWREAHRHSPGTIVHRYRRHIVIAARDGYIQLNRWSPVPATEIGHLGR
jgi:methionyl-tRNA formyltransferase